MKFNFAELKYRINESEYFWPLAKIVLGALLIIFSYTFVNIASFIIGAVLLVMGIIECINYFTYLRHKYENKKLLIKPIVMMVVGLLFIIFPGMFVSLLAFAVGSFLLSMGIYKLQHYVKYLYFNKSFWWWTTVIISGLLILFGLAFIFFPRTSVDSLLIFCGIGLIVSSLQDFADKFQKAGKRLFGKY